MLEDEATGKGLKEQREEEEVWLREKVNGLDPDSEQMHITTQPIAVVTEI